MSRQGMIAAVAYGNELPSFENIDDALQILKEYRDVCLGAIQKEICEASLDFTLESLKRLEAWFFKAGEPQLLPSGLSVTSAIGFYYGQVLCSNCGYHWVVEPFRFGGGRYEIGVTRHLHTVMLTFGICPARKGNKRMQSLWRQAKQYAP